MRKLFLQAFFIFFSFTVTAQTITPAGPVSLCQGTSTVLTASSGDSYQWQKDGVNIGSATGISLTVSSGGSYTVIVITAGMAATSPAVVVTQVSRPAPTFTTPAGVLCSSSAIQFTSAVSGGAAPYSYAWNFNGGGTSTLQNPQSAVTSIGCANATVSNQLTVTDANGCTGSVTNSISVLQGPDVQLEDPNTFSQFSNCLNTPTPANPNFTLTVKNISPGNSCVSSYSLNWGDGSPVQNGFTFGSSLTHTYTELGAFPLTITGVGVNGCTNSRVYTVANQSNPDIGLGSFGPTEGCADLNVNVVVTTWQNNSPGTKYTLQYGDGTVINYTHPINTKNTDDTTVHKYTTTSCPNSLGYPLTITVTNSCRSKTYTGDKIQVKTPPKASFKLPAGPFCTGQAICFLNQTTLGFYTDCSTQTNYSWNFGDGSSTTNTSTLAAPCHTYAAAGTYTITLVTSNPCGPSTVTQQICVSDAAVPAFKFDKDSVCATSTVAVTNTSTPGTCSNVVYAWTVAYTPGYCGTTSGWSFAPGSSASSVNPSFVFTNPGTYTVQLVLTGSCGTGVAKRTVVVKQAPKVSLNTIPDACDQVIICPTATVTNCGTAALTYLWQFDNGTAGTSQNAVPDCVTFSSQGQHTVSVSVTNDCGTTTVTRTFNIGAGSDLTIPADAVYCAASTAGSFVFSTTTPGTVITWTNSNTSIGLAASGNGNINSFTTSNTSAVPVIAIITVKATNNGCATTKTFTITVNPKPALPVVTTPVNYCLNDMAVPLSATALAGDTLLWYTTISGGVGDTTRPVPVTTAPATITFYVSQKNGITGCESNRQPVLVNVFSLPVITGSNSNNPTACASATGSISLTGLTPAVSYAVQYVKNGGTAIKVSLAANANGIVTIPSLTAGTYTDIVVGVNACTANAAGPFTLTDPNPPGAPTVNGDIILCEGSNLALTASTTVAGITWLWTGPSDFTSTQQSPVVNAVTMNNGGDYFVTITSNACTSSSSKIHVTVSPRPAAPVVTPVLMVCLHESINLTAASDFPGAYTWAWTGPNGFTSAEHNPIIPDASLAISGVYSVVITSTAAACASPAAVINVTVVQAPFISDGSFVNPVGCNAGNGLILLKGLQPSAAYTVQYTKDGTPVTRNITSNADGSLTITLLTAGSYNNITVSLNNCISNVFGPFTLTDTPSFSVVAASGGAVCEGSNLALQSHVTATGSPVYKWTGPGNYVSFEQNPLIINAGAVNSGVYTVAATINGCTAYDSLAVMVALKPAGGHTSPGLSVCRGKNAGTIFLTAQTGQVIRWESSVNNGLSWNSISNTGATLTYFNLTATTWYRAVVQNVPCPPVYSDTSILAVINTVDAVSVLPLLVQTCNHDTTITFTASIIYTGNDPIKYSWYVNGQVLGTGNPFAYTFHVPVTNAQVLEYDVRALAQNTAGCGDTSIAAKVIINPVPNPVITVSPGPVQYEPNFSFIFTDTEAVAQLANFSLTWNTGDVPPQIKTGRQISYQYQNTGKYKVNLQVVDRITGCMAKDSVFVTILAVPGALQVPNAFYPNSAHPELRTFSIKGIGIKKYHLQIFDGLGKLVFETTALNADGSPAVAWNGTYLNNGAALPQDAYVWKIAEIEFLNGKVWDGMSYNGSTPKYFGSVTLFR